MSATIHPHLDKKGQKDERKRLDKLSNPRFEKELVEKKTQSTKDLFELTKRKMNGSR